ncbi:hypothetical protein WDW86_05410 [Bdellovibrionota bacterium FG-2]
MKTYLALIILGTCLMHLGCTTTNPSTGSKQKRFQDADYPMLNHVGRPGRF